jgi:hypothetical protein
MQFMNIVAFSVLSWITLKWLMTVFDLDPTCLFAFPVMSTKHNSLFSHTDGRLYTATPVDPVFIMLPIFEEARMKV